MSKTLKWIIAIIVIILIIAGVWYFGSKPTTTLTSNGPIKIGVIIPLTGNYAAIGTKIKNGLEFAKQDWEAKNPGQTIDLVYEDACQPNDAISATQKLIGIDKIKVIGAQFCVIGLVPTLQVTEPARVVNVGIAASVSDVLNKNYYFSPNFSVKDNSVDLAKYAVNNLKVKRAAFIYYNTQLGKDYRKDIGDQFVVQGGQIVEDEMTPLSQMEFRTELTKIKAAKPDVIFVTQLTGALANILKESKELGINAKIIGNYQNEDDTVLSVAGSAAEGFIISSADPLILGNVSNGFSDRFKIQYGVEPDVFATNAYDALSLEIPAYVKCNGNTGCIMSELHKVSDYVGTSGKITINSDGIASKPVLFKVVKNGKFVTI